MFNLFKPKTPIWILNQETLDLIRSIEAVAAVHDLHVALGGSVLHKGQSFKDLDLYVYPHFSYNFTRHMLYDFACGLTSIGIKGWECRTEEQLSAYEIKRTFYTAYYEEKRIEFFIFSFPEEDL